MAAHLYELIWERARTAPASVALGGQQGLTWKTIASSELLALVDRLAAELAE